MCVSLIISALTFCRLEEEKRQLQREYNHLPKKEVKEKERDLCSFNHAYTWLVV